MPAGTQDDLIVTGDSTFRVTFLTRGGSVVSDSEYPPRADRCTDRPIALPARCGMVSIECLGKLPAGRWWCRPGFAAVALRAAPAGQRTVAGWQAGNLLPQVGPTTILGRGACLILPQTHIPLRNRQAISQTMVRVTDAVADQIGTETWLPTSVGVVMILLDLQDATATANGDLALSVTGATSGLHADSYSRRPSARPALRRQRSRSQGRPHHDRRWPATGWRSGGRGRHARQGPGMGHQTCKARSPNTSFPMGR